MKTTFKTTVLALLLVCCMTLLCGVSAFAEAPDTELPVRVVTLNGTTGFGMAGLIAAHEAGETALNYSFTVDTDASNVTAALVSGDCDIAALPTNAASALYNKTGGKVQVLALNTRGVLYLVTDGSVEVSSIADLDGQTVYAPAQNPSFIFAALCSKNGIELNIDTSYAQPAELNTAVAAGEVSLAVLPEPMVTVARSQNKDLQVALDLTAEWDKVFEPGSLVQGCVVVRTDFAAEHPAEVAARRIPGRLRQVRRPSERRHRCRRPSHRSGRHFRQGRRRGEGHPQVQRLLCDRRRDADGTQRFP